MRVSFLLFFTILLAGKHSIIAQSATGGGLGMAGSKTVSTSGVILNEFTTLTANAASGATSITVSNSNLNTNGRFSGNLAAGELVMIIQMQGATIDNSNPATNSGWGAITAYNNAGLYEFHEVSSVPNPTTINLAIPLKNSYTSSGKVQVVRVPRYSSFTLNSGASLSTDAWNGSTGGIIAIEANGVSSINGTIDVSGLGFRGGINNNMANDSYITDYATNTIGDAAEKGEGIAGDTTVYKILLGRYGRGAAANGGGGGNAHNAGGGGGSNGDNGVPYNGFGNPDTLAVTGIGTAANYKLAWNLDGATPSFSKNASSGGGRGGYSYARDNADPTTNAPGSSAWGNGQSFNWRQNNGGYGGRPLNNNSGGRIFMGGGGGAGNANDLQGGNGGNGGGIVYILTGSGISGNGTINANGANGANSTGKDGAGGAGGGGTIVIFSALSSTPTGLKLNARGGIGGSQNWPTSSSGETEGPGGGGGGGVVAVATPSAYTINTSGGVNGVVIKSAGNNIHSKFGPNGATMGATGLNVAPPNPYVGLVPLSVSLLTFVGVEKNNAVVLTWATASEINNDFFTIEKSDDGRNFIKLCEVKGAGNSTNQIKYSYTDINPFKGINYYRLTQTDFDGRSKTYNPICIKLNQSTETNTLIDVYPVPLTNYLKVNYSVSDNGKVHFSIVSLEGKIVKSMEAEARTGTNSIAFTDISSLNPGTYFILMKHGSESKILKMLKF